MSQKLIESVISEIPLNIKEDQETLTKRQADTIFNAVLDAMVTEMGKLEEGEIFILRNFGSFKKVHRPERPGRNPQTGESLTIPARNVLRFSPSAKLKEAVQ